MLKQTKILITLLLIFNMVAAGVYWYLDKTIGGHIEEAVAAAQELDFEVKKEEKLKSTEHVINETAQERQLLSEIFVSEDNVVGFIKEIEGLGGVAGVSVDVKTVSVSDMESDFIENLSLILDTEGSWQNSMHFLSLLENIPYAVSIERFNIDEGEEGVWSSNINLSVLKTKASE